MDFPRHLNPTHDTRLVSRADLEADGEIEYDLEDIEDLQARLQETLWNRFKRSLEDGETGAQKKRRKAPEAEFEPVSAAIEFRLISSSLPPREISLGPKPPRIIKVKEPECEDTEEQHQRRSQQAQSIAVDSDWIMGEADKPSYDTRGQVIQLTANLPPHKPVLMITERTNQRHQPSRSLQSQASPHDLPAELCCPITPITEPADPPPKKRKRCPKSKSNSMQAQLRAQPQFWRPTSVWTGYAYGYPMSRPISQGGLRSGYCRDTMRKAVFEFMIQ